MFTRNLSSGWIKAIHCLRSMLMKYGSESLEWYLRIIACSDFNMPRGDAQHSGYSNTQAPETITPIEHCDCHEQIGKLHYHAENQCRNGQRNITWNKDACFIMYTTVQCYGNIYSNVWMFSNTPYAKKYLSASTQCQKQWREKKCCRFGWT